MDREPCSLRSAAAELNQARKFFACGRFWEAALCADRATKGETHLTSYAYKLLGQAEQKLGSNASAAAAWKESLRLEPGQSDLQYVLRILEGDLPQQCDPVYVEDLFDDYAAQFDAHLVGQLAYSGPQACRCLFDRVVGEDGHLRSKAVRALDLGCGTGLSGVPFRELVSHLTGVDISRQMLGFAGKRCIYDQLIHSDIDTAVANFRAAKQTFEIVLIVETLVYFGRLEAVLAGVAKLLAGPGSLLIVTVEELDANDEAGGFKAVGSGRFKHTAQYVRDTARMVGMSILASESTSLRRDCIGGVAHLVIVLTPSDSAESRSRSITPSMRARCMCPHELVGTSCWQFFCCQLGRIMK